MAEGKFLTIKLMHFNLKDIDSCSDVESINQKVKCREKNQICLSMDFCRLAL